MSLRYFPGGPLALRHISFHVESCEKVRKPGGMCAGKLKHSSGFVGRVNVHTVRYMSCACQHHIHVCVMSHDFLLQIGIVGRTGSGKTTLLMALFRMINLAGGRIVIDGQDIGALPLREVRAQAQGARN